MIYFEMEETAKKKNSVMFVTFFELLNVNVYGNATYVASSLPYPKRFFNNSLPETSFKSCLSDVRGQDPELLRLTTCKLGQLHVVSICSLK